MSDLRRISIINGRLIDPKNSIDEHLNIHIENGTVASIGDAPNDFKADDTIDANEQIVCPGLIDLSAHLREPGQEHKATIASESLAASHSGITTLCCPPDTDPIIDTPAVAELIRRKAEQTGLSRVLPMGALTHGLEGEQLSEMAALKRAGCIGVSNGSKPILNTLVLRRALEYADTFGLRTFLHAEDPFLKDGGCAHEGQVATRLGLPGIPEAAETVALARYAALAEQTGANIHFCRLSTGTSAKMLGRLRFDKPSITADVSVHQLFLTEMDIEGFNSLCHTYPPLRSTTDRETLRQAVAEGVISAICSDHQPHEDDAKMAPFPATAPGISGLETLLPLTLRLVDEGVLGLTDALARLTSGPADILGLSLGHLSQGAIADICIFDPSAHWILGAENMVSQGKNTPFAGWELQGKVTHTFLAGQLIFKA